MSEEDARAWIRERFGVPRETVLASYAEILRREAELQNLIAASTLDTLWSRHLLDSAQLIPLAGGAATWLDIGSGAGLPGLVVAILTDCRVTLLEPRSKRAMFLSDLVKALRLAKVEIRCERVERFLPTRPYDAVTARAVMNMAQLFSAASHCIDSSTIWLLPKGRNAHSEVAAARHAWQGVFHVEPSITQPDSGIVIAREVRPK